MAQAVTVGIGEEANASFAMVASRMTKVTGIVRNSQGQPISNAMISIRSRSGEGFFGRGLPVGADGRFTFSNIPPGEHWLEVNPRSSDDEVASVAITAGDRDITDLVITTSPGAVISGHVIFDSAAESGRPGRIMVYPPDPGSGPIVFRQFDNTQGTIDSNGRFQMKGVTGRVIFAIGPGGFGLPPSGWSVKKVTVNGQDFTDIPLDMSTTGSIDDVEVVLTDKQTTLSGTVRGAGGAPVTDYTVAIFPERLREGAVPGRYIRVVRPDQQGRFETKGLPPGDYFAAAVESLDQGGQWDPAFRRQVEPAAKRLRLTEGLTSTIELQLIQ
jgi:hypothetical protein